MHFTEDIEPPWQPDSVDDGKVLIDTLKII